VQVTVVTEAHFRQTPDGRIYSDTGGRGYAFWSRYLERFSSVVVAARVSPSSEPGASLVTGPNVRVHALPGYSGLAQLVTAWPRTRVAVRAAASAPGAFILRFPGPLESMMATELHRRRRPYAIELVSDPLEVMRSGLLKARLGHAMAPIYAKRLRDHCTRAAAVSYVTEHALQRLYPPNRAVFTTHYSSIDLAADGFVERPRSYSSNLATPRLVTVGAHRAHKGHDVLLDALARVRREFPDVRLTFVGEGPDRAALERQAAQLSLNSQVTFSGLLPAGKPVRDVLDQADLFVLPSYAEGLPRSLIEAMARGLPAVVTEVGGAADLLPPHCLVPSGDPQDLADAILEHIRQPELLTAESARNLQVATGYRNDVLDVRRREFYSAVEQSAGGNRLEAGASR
jgi:phosphatidylinositol alpha-1,6-mannosyltransferase